MHADRLGLCGSGAHRLGRPIGSLRVLGPTTVASLDIYGSGAETIAHLRENERIVVMLCAFSGPPDRTRPPRRVRDVTL